MFYYEKKQVSNQSVFTAWKKEKFAIREVNENV
jgi:hypothetical protein